MMRRISLLLLMFLPLMAFGQASRYDNIVNTINQSAPIPGGMYPALYIPNSGVAICTAPANAVPCTNYATTYTSSSAATACTAPAQLTRPGSNTCVQGADAQGGFGVWMVPGNYQYTITTTYGSFGPYDFSVGGVAGSGTSSPPAFSVQGSNGLGGFNSDAGITINTTTHTISGSKITSPSTATNLGTSGYQNLPDYLNAITDCGLPSDHVSDSTTALNACIASLATGSGQATRKIFFPRTNFAVSAHGSCDYVFTGTIDVLKPAFEITLAGETGNEDLSSRICTTTTNTGGILVNSEGVTLSHLTFYGADGWVPTNTATYVTTGTADGVKVCGPNIHLDHTAFLYYSRHGMNLDSSTCVGGTTDFASADSFQIYFPYVAENQGNGINVAGSDGNLGIILGGSSVENQLFGFQDRSLYPATVIGLNTTANHNDPNAVTGTVTMTGASVTGGIMTVTCPSACGIETGDTPTLAGSSNSSYNQKYEYSPATSSGTGSSSFTMRTGDVGPNDGTSTTGGTVSYSPGARIWATDNVYGGCCYASISGQGNWSLYAEGNQPGPMVNSMVNIMGAGGTAGNTAFYYAGPGGFANTDSGTFSVLGASIAIGSPNAKITYQQVQNINPATRRLMCTIFRPSGGINGGGGIDVGLSMQAGWCNGAIGGTTPEVIEIGRSNPAPNVDGYWAFTMNDSVLTTASKTFFRLYDLNATTQPPGTVEFPNSNPVLFDTTPLIGTAPIPVTTASPTLNQAVCIKSTGPPIVLGTCSTVVSSGGACTCN